MFRGGMGEEKESVSAPIFSAPPPCLTCRAKPAMRSLPSSPTTAAAPPRAANIERMPVPQPTSSTRAPRTSAGLSSSAARYASVRAASPSISRWMSKNAYDPK